MIKKEMTAGPRIGAMLLDHIVMTFVIMIIAMPVMMVGLSDGFEDDTSSISNTIDWTLYVMIFGMSLYFNKDIIQGKSIAKRAKSWK